MGFEVKDRTLQRIEEKNGKRQSDKLEPEFFSSPFQSVLADFALFVTPVYLWHLFFFPFLSKSAVVLWLHLKPHMSEEEWVTGIRDQCLAANIPFFFKQWGGVRKKRAGRVLQDRTWDEMPDMMGGQVALSSV